MKLNILQRETQIGCNMKWLISSCSPNLSSVMLGLKLRRSQLGLFEMYLAVALLFTLDYF